MKVIKPKALQQVPLATPNLNMDYGDYVVRHCNEVLRKSLLNGPVNDIFHMTASYNLTYLASLSTDPILLTLLTYGGDIMQGLAVHDLVVRVSKTAPVDIMATGACMSMGVIIMQAARTRLATPNAHFMLHELQATNQGDLGEMRDRHRHMVALQKRLNEILSTRTGLTVTRINKLIERKDCYISAQEALDLGLIDRII